MADNNFDALLRTDDKKGFPLENSKEFAVTKRKINNICKELTVATQKYDAENTVNNINNYISITYRLDRILYSEISNFVFSLETTERGIFATNLEKLLLYSLDANNGVTDDTRKIIVKIYDHTQLALHQIENTNNIFANSFANSIEEAKETLQKEVKRVEKEYISILGIFAAIVLTFVGEITFSSSVLQNISEASIYRLLLIVDFLAFILINVIYILVKFIFTINQKDEKLFNIKPLNYACFILAGIIILGWLFDITQLPEFLSNYLPWSR